jgi:hypothetical protein
MMINEIFRVRKEINEKRKLKVNPDEVEQDIAEQLWNRTLKLKINEIQDGNSTSKCYSGSIC